MSASLPVVCTLSDSKSEPEELVFGTCALDALGYPDQKVANLSLSICQSSVTFGPCRPGSSEGSDSPQAVALGHSTCCPVRQLRLQSTAATVPAGKRLKLAVIVLVQNESGALLITRRHKQMRGFPCAWVFPGGAVDPNESLQEAAVRELKEETGLEVDSNVLELLCAWESVYPTRLDLGPPSSHCMIIAYTTRVQLSDDHLHHDLSEKCCFSTQEVDLATWIPADVIKSKFLNDEKEYAQSAALSFPSHLPALAISDEGNTATSVDLCLLRGVYPNSHGQGIGEAHLFALKHLALKDGSASTNSSASGYLDSESI